MSQYFRSFWGKTAILFIVLAAVLALAWALAPHERFIRISLICYGYALGWFGGWVASRAMRPRQPNS